MNNIEFNKLIFILTILFLASTELSSQSTIGDNELRMISKYKYMLPKRPLNEFVSTRILRLEDLELIEYFDKNGKRLKTEKYGNGQLRSTQMFNEHNEMEQLGSAEIRDTTKAENEYDSKSIYGAVMKRMDEWGLEKGRLEEKYEAKYNSNGDLIAEYILSLEGDTIRSFIHYYDDSHDLLRTEHYKKGKLNSTRVFLGGDGKEKWSRIVLFGETGEIRSDDWTKYIIDSPFISRSTTVFKWGEDEGSQSIRNAIYFMDGNGNANKAVYEVNDEILVIEYMIEVIKNH